MDRCDCIDQAAKDLADVCKHSTCAVLNDVLNDLESKIGVDNLKKILNHRAYVNLYGNTLATALRVWHYLPKDRTKCECHNWDFIKYCSDAGKTPSFARQQDGLLKVKLLIEKYNVSLFDINDNYETKMWEDAYEDQSFSEVNPLVQKYLKDVHGLYM